MRSLKNIIFLILLTVLTVSHVHAEIVDRIVAVVNDDVVTLSDLNDAGSLYFEAIKKQVPAKYIDNEMKKAQKEVLKHLIERLIIEQQAQKFNIAIANEDIDNAIENIIKQNNISVEEFRKSLTDKGTTEEKYRDNLKSQLLKNRLVNLEVSSRIVITEKKIKEYYNNNYSAKPTPTGYHINQIGILWGDQFNAKDQQEALAIAKRIRKMLLDGEDFKTIANSYSDLPSAEDGGDIGFFKDDELAPYMAKAINEMVPGDISQVLNTPSGLQILKLVSSNTAGHTAKVPFEEVKSEISAILYKQESDKNYKKWINDLREKSIINISL